MEHGQAGAGAWQEGSRGRLAVKVRAPPAGHRRGAAGAAAVGRDAVFADPVAHARDERRLTRGAARVFERAGFADIRVRSFYRANDYFAFFVPAFIAITAFENLCKAFRWSYFASGFVISGRKPAGAARGS